MNSIKYLINSLFSYMYDYAILCDTQVNGVQMLILFATLSFGSSSFCKTSYWSIYISQKKR